MDCYKTNCVSFQARPLFAGGNCFYTVIMGFEALPWIFTRTYIVDVR